MTKYKTRPGIVMTSICDQYLLVAAEAARRYCPYVTEINETSAFLWKQLVSGADAEALKTAIFEEYDVDDTDLVQNAVFSFIRQMTELNYLLPEEQGGPDEE